MSDKEPILPALMAVIDERRDHPPEGRSYVAALLQGGMSAIGAKITEESREVVETASESGEEGRAHLIHEVADLLFHTLVLLGYHRIGWTEVEAELGRRLGIGGFVEKESRGREPK